MKIVQTSIIVGLAFFLSAGISFGADLDDIDFTIRIVESDDVDEIHNELSLPDMIFDAPREHAEDGGGHGNQENEAGGHEHKVSHEDEVEARDEREDEIEDHDEAREDDDDMNDEHDEAHEEEEHEEEHEKEDNREISDDGV